MEKNGAAPLFESEGGFRIGKRKSEINLDTASNYETHSRVWLLDELMDGVVVSGNASFHIVAVCPERSVMKHQPESNI